MLTVVFDKSDGGPGVPGPWAIPPVAVTAGAILAISSTTQSGDRLRAVFAAQAAGTVTVSAHYGNECAATDTTPCTIAPQSEIDLTVTVVTP